MRWKLAIFGTVVLMGGALAVASLAPLPKRSDPAPSGAPAAATAKPYQAPIADYALDPYTQSGYPKTFKKWGKKGVARIEEVRKLAAMVASKSRSCDQVEIVELSDNRSVPPDRIVIFIDCKNGARLYVTEAEARAGATVRSQAEKGATITKSEILSACTNVLRGMLTIPSTLDRDAWSISYYQAPTTGNWEMMMDFTAKNAFGVEIEHRARCLVSADRAVEVTIVQ